MNGGMFPMRFFTFIAVVFLFAFSSAGCSSNNDEVAKAKAEAEKAKAEAEKAKAEAALANEKLTLQEFNAKLITKFNDDEIKAFGNWTLEGPPRFDPDKQRIVWTFKYKGPDRGRAPIPPLTTFALHFFDKDGVRLRRSAGVTSGFPDGKGNLLWVLVLTEEDRATWRKAAKIVTGP
jgi:hypothetical protein